MHQLEGIALTKPPDEDVAGDEAGLEPAGRRPVRDRFSWPWVTAGLIAGAGALLRVPTLRRSLMDDRPFRETQTAFTTSEFAHHGIHLLHPTLPLFGPPWTVALEFPLFQAVAALFMRAGLSTTTSGRLLGLVCFEVTALLVFAVVQRVASPRAAIVAMVLAQAVPYSVFFASTFLIEFMATAFALGSIVAVWRWYDGRAWLWLPAAALLSAGAFLVKITTALVWIPPLLAVAWLALRADKPDRLRRVVLGLLVAPGVGLAAGVWWTHYADAEKARNPFTLFLTSHQLQQWNYGTLKARLTPAQNHRILEWTTGLITGPWPWLVLVVLLVLLSRRNRLLKVSVLVVPLLAVEAFFNLYHHNDYYLAAVLPALVAAVAIAIDEGADRLAGAAAARRSGGPQLPRSRLAGALAALGVVGVLAGTWLSGPGRDVLHSLGAHRPLPPAALLLRHRTPADAKIIVVGCDWFPGVFFYGHRRGLMWAPHTRQLAGRPSPVQLQAAQAAAGYQYVLNASRMCHDRDASADVPTGLRLQPLGQGLYKILGAG